MKQLFRLIPFLLLCGAGAENKIPNADFRQGVEGFKLYGTVENVPEAQRSLRGDLLIREGGITARLHAGRWKPGMYKLSVRFRETGGDRSMVLVATIRGKAGLVSKVQAVPESDAGGDDVVYSALVPLSTDAQLNIWCKGSRAGSVGIDSYNLVLLPEHQIVSKPPVAEITGADAVTEEFKVTLRFRNHHKNSRGAVLERADDGFPFQEVARSAPYAHSVIDPDASAGRRCRYRVRNLSDGGESDVSKEFCVEIPAFERSPGGRNYYVDALAGSDDALGDTPERAWKSLAKVSRTVFAPGDRIFLRRGGVWRETLELRGSGTKEEEITLKSYGEGELPHIMADHRFAVRLRNREFWNISELALSNSQEVPKPKKEVKYKTRLIDRNDGFFLPYARSEHRSGFLLELDNCGVREGIKLHRLCVTDVEGTQQSKENGGITVDIDGYRVPSRMHDLEISSCEIRRVCRSGIVFRVWPHARRSDWFPSTDVKITGNKLYDIGGDGIVPWACDGALVAQNEVYRAACSAYEANVAIWPWSCDNTLISKNIAAFTAKHPGNGDGQGFDADTNNRNTILENNLSYHNEGGFILICGEADALNRGVIVRNNISVSDGMAIFTLWNNLEDVRIYNNTIWSPDNSKAVYLIANWGRGDGDPIQMKNVEFFNNLVAADTPLAFRGIQKSWNIHHNLYTGNHAKKIAQMGRGNIVRDPEFAGKIDTAANIPSQLKMLVPRNVFGGVVPEASFRLKSDYFGSLRGYAAEIGALTPESRRK